MIRPAAVADAPCIANVHIHSWRETYSDLFSKRFMDHLSLEFSERYFMWRAVLETGEDSFFVADHSKYGPVGFACGGKSREGEYSDFGELYAIYLLKVFHGNQLGYQLQRKVFDSLKEEGLCKAFCWVLEANPAICFYERTGASQKDFKKGNVGDDEITEIRMVWDTI